jgi:hypothetical protein
MQATQTPSPDPRQITAWRHPERLAEPGGLENFCQFFIQHGALGGGGVFRSFTEEEKASFLPMIFGFMPRSAVEGRRYDTVIKPIIRQHLQSIRIEPSDELVSIVKSVSDQFFKTTFSRDQRNKHAIGDLRARPILYKKIIARQKERCAVCGACFNNSVVETLDHIVPFKLIGDVPNGANWQILCLECNQGKSAYLSVFQMPEFFNWLYSFSGERNSVANGLRYAVLMRDACCTYEKCGKTSSEAQLFVVQVRKFGLSVLDMMGTFCEGHANQP